MKMIINKDIFTKALGRIQAIVEKKNTMPILANVLLEARDGRLFVTATDLEVGMRSPYPADVISEGKITVPAKKLFDIIKEMPNEDVTFTTKENEWVEIVSGKVRFNIVGLSPDEYPHIPNAPKEEGMSLAPETILSMLENTSYAICTDETKYNLNGVLMKAVPAKETGSCILTVVATDGHRLSVDTRTIKCDADPKLKDGVIVPRKGVYEIKKLAEETGDISFSFLDNSLVVKKGENLLLIRLIDGDFPKYEAVMPKANNLVVQLRRDAFLSSLKRMALLSSDKYKGVKIDISPGQIVISSSNPELGNSSEELEATYTGAEFSARYNAKYIMELLAPMTEKEVVLRMKDDLSPILVEGADSPNYQGVVMPMRL